MLRQGVHGRRHRRCDPLVPAPAFLVVGSSCSLASGSLLHSSCLEPNSTRLRFIPVAGAFIFVGQLLALLGYRTISAANGDVVVEPFSSGLCNRIQVATTVRLPKGMSREGTWRRHSVGVTLNHSSISSCRSGSGIKTPLVCLSSLHYFPGTPIFTTQNCANLF